MKYLYIFIITIFLFILLYKIQIVHSQNYQINVNYPKTNYNILNCAIKNKIDNYINNFKKYINTNENIEYSLIINYDKYLYNNYVSYVFMSEYYTGGAHPNHDIWTIVFDTNHNKIITLNDLINYNKTLLNTFSSYSRNHLIYNKKIVDTSMMLEGTRPIKDNFSNFLLTEDGILLFFNRYQVAPYSSGYFKLIIPYQKIKPN